VNKLTIILLLMMVILTPNLFGDRSEEIKDKIDKLGDAISKESDKYHSVFNQNSHPILSPDGKFACFTASIGTYTNKIYFMDLKSNRTIYTISSKDIAVFDFTVSRDGKNIMYIKHLNGKNTNEYFCLIVLMRIPDGETRTIFSTTNESIELLRLTSDESKIYFVKWDNPFTKASGKRIYCVGTNGQNLIRMEDRPYFTVDNIVSLPDNKTIVYSASGDYFDKDNGYGIFMANEDTRKEIPVKHGFFSNACNYRLVFSQNYSNYVYAVRWIGIYKLPIDNPSLFEPDIDPEPLVKLKRHKGNFQDLSLSPDGKRILFNEFIKVSIISTNIMGEMDLDGNILRHLPVSKEDLMKAEVYKVE